MKISIKAMVSIMAALTAGVGTSVADTGVEIEHLGVNNTLVRVNGQGRYLILPVQESNDDARINVIVDSKLDRTLGVKLAKTKVDYCVPFDVTPYKGHDLILMVATSQDRGSVREAKQDACWKNMCLTDTFDLSNHEQYRPAYHHTPYYGWMNDPNGMFYDNGVWHLYYQYNPYGSKWQNMSWGHSSSKDLIHWEHHPVAIEPNALGMVFSGSSVLDLRNSAGFGENAVVALFTSAELSQTQSLAWSNDGGETFNLYKGNPVLTQETESRDPNMFWYEPTGEWVMVLAHPLDHEMQIYTSPDLKTWTLRSSFGKGLGGQDGVWECPDLFELPMPDGNGSKWVLISNINPGGPFGGSAVQYFVGDFDGHTFVPDKDTAGNVPTKWLDYGKDNYAIVSWSGAPDNRRTVIGWMSNWQYAGEVPTMQFRSANTLPRDLSLFRGADGQLYVASAPSPELTALRDKAMRTVSKMNIAGKAKTLALPEANDGICEIVLTIDPLKSSATEIVLANEVGEKVTMTYDAAAGTLAFDRNLSGNVVFSQDFPAETVAPVFSTDGRVTLRIYVDRSSIEVFGNDGRFVMTNLVFPTRPYSTLSIKSEGGSAKVSDLTIYPVSIK